ncbi:putative CCR4-NOT transcription complex subunit 6-like [Triplophysa rosa]|uniref:CCR4-NOT transcription complex subunit 6-like n=1 Tax=Triplophysa rosa TaxID=992332 RepID=A0A9W7X2P2_TRIRA|nr:putative CCR4-NOT transcription complex subunit 6-like [Triplophysa rosa]
MLVASAPAKQFIKQRQLTSDAIQRLVQILYVYSSLLKGMPKEKYDPPDPRRLYTIMSSEAAASGKKSNWTELEISGRVRSLSSSLWTLTHLTALHINNNNLSRIPPEIAKLPHLVFLNLSSNKLRSLPAELGNMVTLSPPRTTTPKTLDHFEGARPNDAHRFALVQKHTVEFNQVAMANSEGSEVMLNRVMTKDNIGVAVLLEVEKELFASGLKEPPEKQLLLVANAHMHWDPEYSDVKLIQTMMFLSELKSITERASSSINSTSPTSDIGSIPIVLCADLNSLPDSGVVEYLSNGGVAENHKDFKELRYSDCLTNFSCNGKNGKPDGSITHSFHLKSSYEGNLMPYTNYTYDFKGVIDYIFFSKTHMSVLGVLGPLETQWLRDNNITGCPHPHIPSDHFSLLAQLEYHPPLPPLNGVHLPVHSGTACDSKTLKE